MKWCSILMVLVVQAYGDYIRDFSGSSTNRIRSREKENVIFARPVESSTEEQIPLWILEDLDQIHDPNTFLTQFVEDGLNFTSTANHQVIPLPVSEDGSPVPPEPESRHSDRRVVEADGGPVFATPAGCKPQPTVIPLYDEFNPRMIVYPKCTIVNQCQGCCNLASHSCQPKNKEPIFVRVIKAMYVGGGRKLTYLGKFTVQLEKHNECECACKVKATDCNIWQKHNPYTCKCDCKDDDARRDCLRDMQNRMWEDTSCTCRCRQERPCSSGLYFDHDSCSCRPLQGMLDGFPRVFPAGRHSYNPVDDTAANITYTPLQALPPSSTTTTPTPTTTSARGRRKDENFYRRLRQLRNRYRQRSSADRDNVIS